MNLENRQETVKSGAELTLPQETKEKNTEVFPKECRCTENSTCDYCCILEYKKAWRVLRQQPLILSRRGGSICHSENVNKQEETVSYSEKTENDAHIQSNVELDGAYNTKVQPSDKPKISWDTDFRCNEVQNYVDSDSEETKDADFCYNLEQSNGSWDDRTIDDSDCLLETASKETLEAGTEETDGHCKEEQDTSDEVGQIDFDANTCLSDVTKDLERSNESCDIKTDMDSDSSVKRTLRKTPNVEVFTDSVGESCKRTRRNSKRKRDVEDSCPVCGLTIRSCELESHYQKEVENLSKIHKNSKRVPDGGTGVSITFVQVKCNRENRLAAKIAKYTKKTVNQVQCPVCCLKLNGSEDEINDHVLNCSEEDTHSDINIMDNEDSFEEYEFGNETRVRAISFIPGGYRALHGHCSVSKTVDDDEDLNVDVDVDDTLKYGKPQYSELDVIHNLTDAAEAKQLEQLRKAVIDPTAEPNVLESRKWTNSTDKEIEKSQEINILENVDADDEDTKSENLETKSENSVQNTIISSLREKIKNLEDQSKNVKCLICLEPYTKPVVSTACWHVYCEECWLMTMGVKKLCPQCSIIVFPSDLRRIYL